MIHDDCLSILQDSLAVSMPHGVIREDVWRLENAWYGTRVSPEACCGIALYLGGRSGLEILLANRRTPNVEIHVVENNRRHRNRLEARIPFVKTYASFAEFETAAAASRIDYIRAESSYYEEILAPLTSRKFEIGTLAIETPANVAGYEAITALRRVASNVFVRHSQGGKGFDSPAPDYDVSVIVPAYKVEAELVQCLDSLAHQTLERLEVIVVDDGSTDRSGAIADEFATAFPGRIRVIHQENAGCAAARSAGLASAQGEFVGFVDGDDWVDRNMFKHLHMLAMMSGTDIAQCGFRLEYQTGETVLGNDIYAGDGPFRRSGIVWNMEELLPVQPTIWRRIYRRSFLASQGITFPAHIRRFDDLPFQFECFAKSTRIATTPEPYYAYRQGRVGQDILAKDDRLFVHFPIFDYLKERVLDLPRIGIVAGLLQSEINTHLWATGRIEKKFLREYRRRAAKSLAHGYEILGPRRFLQVAARTGGAGVALAIRALMTKPDKAQS